MTLLSLDAPLVGLLTLAGITQEALAHACTPRQTKQAVTVAAARGDRIRLSTLAAYARAAGYKLWLVMQAPGAKCRCGEMANGNPHPPRADCNYCAGEWPTDVCWCHIGERRDHEFTYPPAAAAENHEATVSQARALVERLGFAMVLAVEPAEESGR